MCHLFQVAVKNASLEQNTEAATVLLNELNKGVPVSDVLDLANRMKATLKEDCVQTCANGSLGVLFHRLQIWHCWRTWRAQPTRLRRTSLICPDGRSPSTAGITLRCVGGDNARGQTKTLLKLLTMRGTLDARRQTLKGCGLARQIFPTKCRTTNHTWGRGTAQTFWITCWAGPG